MAVYNQPPTGEKGQLGQAAPMYYAPPNVAYTPAAPQGVTILNQVARLETSEFLTDYRAFSIIVTILFGLFGPQSLITGIPAVILAVLGYRKMEEGKYKQSRFMSLASVYLTFTTVFISVIFTSVLAFFLLLFRHSYSNPVL